MVSRIFKGAWTVVILFMVAVNLFTATGYSAEVEGGDSALPLVVTRMTSPNLDGRVNPKEWQSACSISFTENSGKTLNAQTRAYVGYDDNALYVAFICDEPMMDKAVKQIYQGRDPPVYQNECVEVFLAPQADRANFMHFIVDILNQHWDGLGSDYYGYNPQWASAVYQGDKYWSVEIGIPFSSLGVEPPKSGALWYANLNRERKVQDELSAWQPTFGLFEAAGRFGTWIFGSLKAHLESQSSSIEQEIKDWPEKMAGLLADWRKQIEHLKNRLSSMDEKEVRAKYGQMAGELNLLREQLGKLKIKLLQLSGAKSFIVAQSWPYEPFQGKPSGLDRPAEAVDMTLLQDEWADLAWNVTNQTERTIALRWTTRNGDAKDRHDFYQLGIPGAKTLWQQAIPVAMGDGQLTYDAIVPQPAGIIQIPPGGTSQVWLSIHVPKGAKKNISAHVVIEPVDGTAGEPIIIPLSIGILPVELTAKPAIHGFTWNLYPPGQKEWHEVHLADLKAHGVDISYLVQGHLPQVKANPDGTLAGNLDFTQLDAELEESGDLFDQYFLLLTIFQKGHFDRNLFGLDFGTPEYEKAFKTWFSLVLDHLKSRGVGLERLLICPYDEQANEDCRTLSRWMKEVNPNVRIIIDSSTTDMDEARKMDALTDVWVPHYKAYIDQAYRPFFDLVRASKKPLWCYYYAEGPSEKAKHPTSHYLAKFWWAFANDVTGIAYWCQRYYGDPWYRAATPGDYDTLLVYPIEGDVVPSRRWQAWRQGWQDHCLLTLTREYLEQAEDKDSLLNLEKYVKEVVSVAGDPVLAENVRRWCKKILISEQ